MGEEPLSGGRNAEEVVRVGDTVRRAREPGSEFAARVLRHLESAGYPYAPRHLGIDDRGRDILTYVPGRTTDHPSQRADGAYARGALMLGNSTTSPPDTRLPRGANASCTGTPGRSTRSSPTECRSPSSPKRRAWWEVAVGWAEADREFVRANEQILLTALR